MRLVECRNGIEVYDIGNGYTISKETAKWMPFGILIIFYPCRNGYLPSISQGRSVDGGSGVDFSIQTTSYGSLPPSEIKKVIVGYETAIQTIDAVIDEFFKEV